MRPSLAVLITYHDEKGLLSECLDSIFRQADRPDEVLVYDDASRYPAQEFVPAACPVRIIRGDANRGPAHGRNRLLAESTSDYIHFHDSDDLFEPGWTAAVRQAIASTGADVVLTEIRSTRNGELLSPAVLGLDRLARERDLLGFCVGGAMLVPTGTYRRALVSGIGGYDEALLQAEDFDFHVRMALASPSYSIVAGALVEIRVREGSRSARRAEVFNQALKAIAGLKARVPERWHPQLGAFALQCARNLAQLGDEAGARQGFTIAAGLCGRAYPGQPLHFRIAASTIGPLNAERLAARYRALPERLRRWLHVE